MLTREQKEEIYKWLEIDEISEEEIEDRLVKFINDESFLRDMLIDLGYMNDNWETELNLNEVKDYLDGLRPEFADMDIYYRSKNEW